jgi:hypothetical protein
MSESVSILATQIERIVKTNFRRTRYAVFQLISGWIICEIWFEDGSPRMQIRSDVRTLEEAAIVATGIHMAIDWAIEETAKGGNLPVEVEE